MLVRNLHFLLVFKKTFFSDMPYVKERHVMHVSCSSSVANVSPQETLGFLSLNIYVTFTPHTKLSTGSTDFFLHTNLHIINIWTKAATLLFCQILSINIKINN